MNKYYGTEWGLADREGVSQLASNTPPRVQLSSNEIVEVYTRSNINGISIPYYYLSNFNISNNFLYS